MTDSPLFLNYVAAGYPLLWIQTHEEFRAMTTFAKEIAQGDEEYTLYSWDQIDGVKVRKLDKGVLKEAPLKDDKGNEEEGLDDSFAVLDWAGAPKDGMGENSILFLQDYHHFIKKDQITRKIRNILPYFRACGKVLVIISHSVELPDEIEKEVTPIQFLLPDVNELRITLRGISLAAKKSTSVDPYPKNDLPILEAALGMTSLEAENAFALSLREKKAFDATLINREKATIVKKTKVLEVIEVKETLDDVGGLDNVKAWLKTRENSFTEKARKFGLKPPKGLLMGGLPGTGKSLTAKCTAAVLKRPLLRLDIGKILDKYVGGSESNMRKCLDIADAVAPCLTGDAKILLANGKEELIKDLYHKYLNGGFEVISYDKETAKLTPSKVLRVTKKVTLDSYRMTYSDGESIGYSWNHLQPVMRDGVISWIKTEDVYVNDYVAVPLGETETASTNLKDYLPSDSRFYKKYSEKKRKIRSSYEEASTIASGSGGYTDSLLSKWPEDIDIRIFYLLGLIMSDGSISKNRVAFTNSQRILIDTFKQLIKNLFGIDCKEIYYDEKAAKENGKKLKQLKDSDFSEFWVVYFNSKIISHVLKKVTEHIRGFSHDRIMEFLSGYIDGDGCILPTKYPRIIFCCHDKNNRYLIKSLLKRIGILPSPGTEKDITVSGDQVKYLKNLSLSHPERRKKLKSLKINDKKADRVVVFPIGRLITEMRENTGLSSNKFKTASSSEIHAWGHNLRPIPQNRLENLISELSLTDPIWAKKFRLLIDTPLRWVKVISKRKTGKKEVYDLCCEYLHNFIANGILTHNCVLWIDELEKAFSGTKGGSDSTSDTKMTVYSTFLTWLQEKTSDVFIVATANDVAAIDEALLSRINCIFWVDLPAAAQREEIISIHLRKINRDSKNYDIKKLAKISDKFSGREIENWIAGEALPYAFSQGHEDLLEEDLLKTAKEIVPQAIMMAEDIQRYRTWAKEHQVKPASTVIKEVEVPVTVKTTRKMSLGPSGSQVAN